MVCDSGPVLQCGVSGDVMGGSVEVLVDGLGGDGGGFDIVEEGGVLRFNDKRGGVCVSGMPCSMLLIVFC